MPISFSLWFSSHPNLKAPKIKLDFEDPLIRVWLDKMTNMPWAALEVTLCYSFNLLALFPNWSFFSCRNLYFSQKAYENFGENMLLLQCRNPASLPKPCNLVSIPLTFLLSGLSNDKVIKCSWEDKISLKYVRWCGQHKDLQSLYFKAATEYYFQVKK